METVTRLEIEDKEFYGQGHGPQCTAGEVRHDFSARILPQMNQVSTMRPYAGWHLRGIFRKHVESTKTHRPLDEEYWLALRHPAEVEAAGLALLAANHPTFSGLSALQQDLLRREFRAYVRQAEGFYRGACVLPWKSSPLNYYYAFMNLAKALALVTGLLPPPVADEPRRLRHGLSARVVPGPPEAWRLTTGGADEIFAMLYRRMVGVEIPPHTELDAHRLLGYSESIAWQLEKSGLGSTRAWFPCYWVMVSAAAASWSVIGVPRGVPPDRLPATFEAEYEEVSPDGAKSFALVTLGLHAVQALSVRFLQGTPEPNPAPGVTDARALDRRLKASAPNCVFEFFRGTEFEFALGLPYVGTASTIPMDEVAASYAVMFFLSSLVRYHPDYMDRIGESSDAWLIESFTKSAPLNILRALVSLILGYSLIIDRV